MPDPTPGERAYVAYVQVRYGLPEADAALTYVRSIPEERAAWDAAAEAVLADGRGHARALVQHWHAWHRDAHAPALPLLTAMHALEAWLAQLDVLPRMNTRDSQERPSTPGGGPDAY